MFIREVEEEGDLVIIYIRLTSYIIGLLIFAYGIATTINVQHLGIHPWDVLNVGLYNIFGLSIGTWNLIVGIILIVVALILDGKYVRIGTFFNAMLVSFCVDFYLRFSPLLPATHTWTDGIVMIVGIIIMGVGGGIYNAPQLGAGPRDGFMLSISDKTGWSVSRVRITSELVILCIGLLIGGPVFIFTLIFTFIQSPIFQYIYLKYSKVLYRLDVRINGEQARKTF